MASFFAAGRQWPGKPATSAADLLIGASDRFHALLIGGVGRVDTVIVGAMLLALIESWRFISGTVGLHHRHSAADSDPLPDCRRATCWATEGARRFPEKPPGLARRAVMPR